MTIRTVIIGATGYSGAELIGLLLEHPVAEPVGLFASEQRGPIADHFGGLRDRCDLLVEQTDIEQIAGLQPHAAFLATPAETSLELAPALLDRGIVVIDLSAAFRLRDRSLYSTFYGFDHPRDDLLEQAVYGLVERNRDAIADTDLISVPGCYPTSVILAVGPLVDEGLVDTTRPVIIDATSGVSGAGRSPAVRTQLCELSLQPYDVLTHRHAPEIESHVGAEVIFTPHLARFDRGLLSTIHVPLVTSSRHPRTILESTYADETFIRILPEGRWPALSDVCHTNFCDIGLASHPTRPHLIVSSAIDNLVKGAAGQALQCLNIRFGLDDKTGLFASGTTTWQSTC